MGSVGGAYLYVCVCVCVCTRLSKLSVSMQKGCVSECLFMFNSNSKFKKPNLAEKALVLNFVPDAQVWGEGVSVRVMHRFRNIFHLVLINIPRYAFFLIVQVIVRLKYVYFVLALI